MCQESPLLLGFGVADESAMAGSKGRTRKLQAHYASNFAGVQENSAPESERPRAGECGGLRPSVFGKPLLGKGLTKRGYQFQSNENSASA